MGGGVGRAGYALAMPGPDEYRVFAVKSWREATADVVAPGRKFLLFVAADVVPEDSADLVEWAKPLILGGCCGVTAWGRNCRAVEDQFDWAGVWLDLEGLLEIDVVMTTSHEGDSLDEALWVFLMPTTLSIETPTKIAVVEDREDWVGRVKAAFEDPGEFCSQHAERNP